jgi:hypothetical protein
MDQTQDIYLIDEEMMELVQKKEIQLKEMYFQIEEI